MMSLYFSLTSAFRSTLTSSDRLYSYILSFERLACLRHVCACSSVQSTLLALTFSRLVQHRCQFYRNKTLVLFVGSLGFTLHFSNWPKCVTAGCLIARLHPSRLKLSCLLRLLAIAFPSSSQPPSRLAACHVKINRQSSDDPPSFHSTCGVLCLPEGPSLMACRPVFFWSRFFLF